MRNWNAKPVRVSLDLDPEEKALLDRLVKTMNTKTGSRLLRQALRFYGTLVDHKQDGFLIQAIKGGKLYQFPTLDAPYPQPVTPKKP